MGAEEVELPEFERNSACPDPSVLVEFAQDDLTRRHDDAIAAHLESCTRCRDRLDGHDVAGWMNLPAVRRIAIPAQRMPVLEGYDVIERVGKGGQGVVYKAIEKKIERFVAIKTIDEESQFDAIAHGRLIEEAKAAGRLNHPHIVRILSVLHAEMQSAIVMEWLGGGTLAQRLKNGKIELRDAVTIMIDITDAVSFAHRNGIIHRDIKPGNIVFEDSGFRTARLTDFGLAKRSRTEGDCSTTSDMVGSPNYMSPEAISSLRGKISERSDIYSLGSVLYHILAGRAPFESHSPIETVYLSLNHDPIPPRVYRSDVPDDLETICLKCLAKDPNERYSRAQDLLEDLKRFAEGRPILAKRDPRWKPALRWARRNPAATALASALIILIVVTIAALTILLNRANASEIRSRANANLANENLIRARESERIAESRLTDSIDALGISTPIFKRFLESVDPNPGEIRKIDEFRQLCQKMAIDSKDPVERLKFHYVTLELGDSLFKIETRKTEAIEWTRTARKNIGEFLERLDDRSGSIDTFVDRPDVFVFRLAEKAHIQYAHACSQLAGILISQAGGPGRAQPEHIDLLEEAIEHAETALESNAELDEARGDIANYRRLIAMIRIENKEFESAKSQLNKALALSESLRKTYPDDPGRWLAVVRNIEQVNQLAIEVDKDLPAFYANLDRLEELLSIAFLRSGDEWNEVTNQILMLLESRPRLLYRTGDAKRALDLIDRLIAMSGSLKIAPSRDFEKRRRTSDLRVERIALLRLMDSPRSELDEAIERTRKLFEEIDHPELKSICLANLMMCTSAPDRWNHSALRQAVFAVEGRSDQWKIWKKLSSILDSSNGLSASGPTVDWTVPVFDDLDQVGYLNFARAEALIRSGQIDKAATLLNRLRIAIDRNLRCSLITVFLEESLELSLQE
ncbi:protein kinase [bacterium]|nr:protein kinase [bacterium]